MIHWYYYILIIYASSSLSSITFDYLHIGWLDIGGDNVSLEITLLCIFTMSCYVFTFNILKKKNPSRTAGGTVNIG